MGQDALARVEGSWDKKRLPELRACFLNSVTTREGEAAE